MAHLASSPAVCPPAAAACRLIVNADDFGLSDGVNEAVIEAHRAGVLTSCSLMVAEPAAGAAAALARERPALAVGLHLTLLRGRACLPPDRIPALAGRDGRFGDDPVRVGMRYFCSPRARRQLRDEVEAQFERFAAMGLPLSHVDAHLHFHLHPVLFAAALDLAPRYGCRRIRIPQDSWSLHRRIDRARAGEAPLAALFALFCARLRRRARAAGMVAPGWVFGLYRTGRLDGPYLTRLAAALPEGTHELHCHPDTSTASGRAELAALRSPEFRAALAKRGAAPATYADLDPA